MNSRERGLLTISSPDRTCEVTIANRKKGGIAQHETLIFEGRDLMARHICGWSAVGLAMCLVLGCSGGGTESTSTAGGDGGSAKSVKLQGSGASFPFPLYGRWFKEYSAQTPGVTIDYQAKGSGAGIKDFVNGTVDFAASDAAMTDEEIAQVETGVVLLPMTAGKVVLAYNLPNGPAELKLSREAYTKIFLGEIAKWNDPVIAAANEGAALPDLDITVVRRADSSGTTFVFTQHMSAVSPAWAAGPGTGKTVEWPSSDKIIASPKNDGVTATIKQTPGAIGYIEFGYATQTGLPMAALENQAGKYIAPTLESGTATLAGIEMPEDLRAWSPDPSGDNSYPIVTYTWLLCYETYDDPAKAEALKECIRWCLTEGQSVSGEMGYVPLPENVVEVVTKAVDNIQ